MTAPSEERFRTLFESAPIGIAVHSADGNLIETNRAYQRMLGYSEDELRELGVRRVTHPDDVAEGRRLFDEIKAGVRENYQRTKRLSHKDGRVIWAKSTASAIRAADGTLRYIISAVENTTELHHEEASHRALLAAVPDSMFGMLSDGTILGSRTTTNDPIVVVLRESRGLRLQQVWPAALVTQTMGAVEGALRTGLPQQFEFQPDVPEPIRRFEARVVRSGEREVLVILRDRSEEVRLQREVLNISSQERQRIGKDLHDDLCQLLTGLGYLAQSVQTRLGPAEAATPACARCASASLTAGHIVDLADKALTWTRKLSRELVSEGLERGGLFPALGDLAETIEQLFRISCSVRWDPGIQFANRAVEDHLYRIIQEAITNAVRHGHARRIWVELSTVSDRTVLTVRDDGVGLRDVPAGGPGVGLSNMRYRARQIGAELDIQPASGGGTVATCRMDPPPASHEPERLLSPSLSSTPGGGEGARRAGEEAPRSMVRKQVRKQVQKDPSHKPERRAPARLASRKQDRAERGLGAPGRQAGQRKHST